MTSSSESGTKVIFRNILPIEPLDADDIKEIRTDIEKLLQRRKLGTKPSLNAKTYPEWAGIRFETGEVAIDTHKGFARIIDHETGQESHQPVPVTAYEERGAAYYAKLWPRNIRICRTLPQSAGFIR